MVYSSRMTRGNRGFWISSGIACALASACGSASTHKPVVSGTGETTTVADNTVKTAHAEPVFQHVHRGYINVLKFSPDGSVVVAVSDDGSASIIDARTGEIRAGRRVWIRRPFRVTAAFDQAGTRVLLAAAGDFGSGTAYVWDLETGAWLKVLTGASFQGIAALHPDGDTVAFVEYDAPDGGAKPVGMSLVLQATRGEPRRKVVKLDSFAPTSIDWSPSGTRLLLRSDDGALQLHDGADGRLLHRVDPDANGGGLPYAFRPDGGAFAIGGPDGAVVIRDAESGAEQHRVEPIDGHATEVARWTATGDRLIIQYAGATTQIVDGETAANIATLTLEGPHAGTVTRSVWAPDGAALYTLHNDGSVRRWNGSTAADEGEVGAGAADEYFQELVISPDGGAFARVGGQGITFSDISGEARAVVKTGRGEHSVWGVSWAPDSKGIVTWGRAGVEVWDARGGARATKCRGRGRVVWAADSTGRYYAGDLAEGFWAICDLTTGEPRDIEVPIAGVSADGRAYFVLDKDELAIHDAATGEKRGSLGSGKGLWNLQLSADGSIAIGMTENTVRIIDARDGKLRAEVLMPGTMHKAELAPDASTVLTSGDVFGALYDTSDGGERASFGVAGEQLRTAYSTDGKALAYASGAAVTVRATGAGGRPVEITAAGPVQKLSFAENGRVLITVSDKRLLQLWSATDGAARGTLELPQPSAYDVSPDGASVASCGARGVRVVAVATGKAMTVGDSGLCHGVAFSPDGRFLAVREGPVVRVFRLGTQRVLTLRTVRADDQDMVLAYDEGGAFVTAKQHLSHLRFREAGPVTTAELRPVTELTAAHANLVQDFFGGVEPTQ